MHSTYMYSKYVLKEKTIITSIHFQYCAFYDNRKITFIFGLNNFSKTESLITKFHLTRKISDIFLELNSRYNYLLLHDICYTTSFLIKTQKKTQVLEYDYIVKKKTVTVEKAITFKVYNKFE